VIHNLVAQDEAVELCFCDPVSAHLSLDLNPAIQSKLPFSFLRFWPLVDSMI